MSNLIDDLRIQGAFINSDSYDRYLDQDLCIFLKEPGKYPDGDGLFLLIRDNGEKVWVYQFISAFVGKLYEIEIGVFEDMSIDEARDELLSHRVDARVMLGDTPG